MIVRAPTAMLLLLTATFAATSAVLAAGDKKIGKWKLRVAPPAHGTREYEDRGDGVTVSTRQGVNVRGQEYYSSYAAKESLRPRSIGHSKECRIA